MSRTYGKAQDLIDFTRASSGTALRRVKYGAEQVVNGTFDNGLTGWNNSPTIPMDTFEVSSGRLHIVNTAGTVEAAYSDDTISLVAGRMYTFSADLEKVGGTDNWDIDIRSEGTGTVRNFITNTATTQTLVVHFIATVTEDVVIQFTTRSTFDGYADNISVKEVTFDTSDGDLILFNHPNNIPRIEYDANGNVLGLLVEESRSNILPYSQAFDAVDWFKTRGDVASESISDPFGGQGAFSWTANDFAESHIGDGATISSGATVTFSAFVKKKTADYCHLLAWDNSANGCRVWFDLVNGQVGTDTSFGSTFVVSGSSITESANGWYRCSMTVTTSGSTTAVVRLQPSNGNGDINSSVGKSIYIYGAQVEQASFPTSYIPTSGSTATRSADVASLSTSAFGFNSEQGSVVVEADSAGSNGSDYPQAFSLDGASTGHAIRAGFNTTNLKQFVVVDSGTNQCILNNGAYSPNDLLKLSIAYKENDFASSSNGDAVATDTSGTVPTVSALSVGKWQNGNHLNGHIKSVKYYPRRLLNTQLVELTS